MVAADGALTVRTVFSWQDGALRGRSAPSRAAREPSSPSVDHRWFE
jgi:hypothetical protein